MPISYIRAKVQVLAAPLLFQPPSNAPKKAADDDPSADAPATYLGDSDGGPGPWLCLGPAMAIAAI